MATVAICSGFAHAQSSPGFPESLILEAYSKIQADTPFELEQTGTEIHRDRTDRFRSTLYYSLSRDPRTGTNSLAKIELDSYLYDAGSKKWELTQRAVGDGQNLWIYDPVFHRYYSSFYSVYPVEGRRPKPEGSDSSATSDTPRMLAQLAKSVSGPAASMVRLLREVGQGFDSPTYRSWAPAEVAMQPPTLPPVRDPLIRSRVYMNSSGEQWVLYGPPPLSQPEYYPVVPNRSVAFRLDDIGAGSGSADWRLTGIYFAQRTDESLTDWLITINDPLLTSGFANWVFQPYPPSTLVGWQPLNRMPG